MDFDIKAFRKMAKVKQANNYAAAEKERKRFLDWVVDAGVAAILANLGRTFEWTGTVTVKIPAWELSAHSVRLDCIEQAIQARLTDIGFTIEPTSEWSVQLNERWWRDVLVIKYAVK